MLFNEKFPDGVLYDYNDIDEMLIMVRQADKKFTDLLGDSNDDNAIRRIVNGDYVAEDFNRYDSAVADEFCWYFNKFCKTEDFEKYSKDVDKEFIDNLKTLFN